MEDQTVLIVDDTPMNIDVLSGILQDNYKVKIAINGELALEIARKHRPDIILLDIMMPGMDGYEVCRRLKQDVETANIPVIFITAKDQVVDESLGFEVGAVDYITKPVSAVIVKARIRTHLALHDQARALENLVRERTHELEITRLEIIRRLSSAAEYRDNETGLHIIRMSKISELIARQIGLDPQEAELILQAAPMHDIGKIGVPDNVLLKPARLNDGEFEIIKQHCENGVRIIGDFNSPIFNYARAAALNHHEKFNGTGYPKGLGEEEIPLIGRILAIADVFDALTSERPYKKAWTVDDAVELIIREKGKHFDPKLVDAFLRILPQALSIRSEFKD